MNQVNSRINTSLFYKDIISFQHISQSYITEVKSQNIGISIIIFFIDLH